MEAVGKFASAKTKSKNKQTNQNVLVEKINRFQFSFLKINPFLSHFYTTAPPAHTQQDTAGCRDSQKGDRARMATQQHEGKENVYRRSTLFTRSLIIRKEKRNENKKKKKKRK
jgi:hypothetical protein